MNHCPTQLTAGQLLRTVASGSRRNNRPLPLEDSTTFTTLHSTASVNGDIIVRALDGKDG